MATILDATSLVWLATPGWFGASVTDLPARVRLGLVRQPEQDQRDAREAEAEFLQRPAPRDGLRPALGQFIELVVHNLPLLCVGSLDCSFAFYPLLPEIGFGITRNVKNCWIWTARAKIIASGNARRVTSRAAVGIGAFLASVQSWLSAMPTPTEVPTRTVCARDAALLASLRFARQPQRGQRDSRETGAEFLQRASPRDGLGQAFGQFIEFVVHNFPFILVWFWFQSCMENLQRAWTSFFD